MNRSWRLMAGIMALLLFGSLGCKSKEIKVKRPDRPEEYVLPPDHARFSQPVSYPRDLLNKTSVPKTEATQFSPGPTRPVSQLGQPGPGM